MIEPRETFHMPEATDYTELLGKLTGVYACGVRLDELGAVDEVHILAGSSRNPKQVVRDARSALYSVYHLDIDHKKFSVAQMREDMIEGIRPVGVTQEFRLLGESIDESIGGTQYRVTVTLRADGEVLHGAATVRNTPTQRLRATAEAVLDAIHQYLGMDLALSLLSVQRITTTPVPVIVVLVECLLGDSPTVLVGAAEDMKSEALGVERATLDAVNRKLAVIKPKEG